MTTRKSAAPMPASLRQQMRGNHHPARAIACPHCRAAAGKPCQLRTRNQLLPQPHPQRLSAWAEQTACCPECQVGPTTPCHDHGIARTTVHARRYTEAQETAA